MNNIVLKIEDVSKQYRLGLTGTGTLSHDINRWWHKIRGKEDPYSQVGVINDRAVEGGEYVWVLKNINIEVKQGEVLGIIGRNGAGKSTLLKLLSKITSPTKGIIKTKGRMASLLEVGTGFHPEFTGRENIYLNGTILGMTKKEVSEKIDDIIEFSGCAKYIDTPVKRYSSGMRVRLGFAVAAFLEPDIMVVDEVLAVGDAEFQKQAIGKMKAASSQAGRTVLFVSHNMVAIKNLCTRVIVLDQGCIVFDGPTEKGVSKYLEIGERSEMITNFSEEDNEGLAGFSLKKISVNEGNSITMSDSFQLKITLDVTSDISHIDITLHFLTVDDVIAFTTGTSDSEKSFFSGEERGLVEIELQVPGKLLNAITYRLDVFIVEKRSRVLKKIENAAQFEVNDIIMDNRYHFHQRKGTVHPFLNWNKTIIN